MPLVELRWRGILEDDAPARADQETDGADLLNAWRVGHADWKFPRPDFFTEGGAEAFRPRVVVVGDSFWWVPDAIIAEQRLASRNEFFYYFNEFERRRNQQVAGQPRGLHRGMSWEYVFSADAVIVETNEAGLGDAGWGFVEAASRQLSGGPPEAPPAP